MPQNQQTDQAQFLDEKDLPRLTAAEYEFVRLLVHEGLDATNAYRRSHDATQMSDTATYSKASRLRGSARIQEWEQALLEWGMSRGVLTQKEAASKMEALARRAERAGNYGAAVNAMDKVNKLSMLYVDQVQDITPEKGVYDLLDGIEHLLGKDARDKAAREMGIFEQESVH